MDRRLKEDRGRGGGWLPAVVLPFLSDMIQYSGRFGDAVFVTQSFLFDSVPVCVVTASFKSIKILFPLGLANLISLPNKKPSNGLAGMVVTAQKVANNKKKSCLPQSERFPN